MPELRTDHLVPYTPEQMFAVVANVAAYPEFVPYCTGMHVLAREQKSETVEVLTARMAIRYKIFEEHYTSCITLDRKALAVDVGQTQGPFNFLINTWRFEPEGKGARIHFYLHYELRSRGLGLVIGPLFRKLFRNFEEAFERRARELWG